MRVKKILKFIANILTVIICIILLSVLMLNIIMIIRSILAPDTLPSINGITPLIVESGSMEPEFHTGDLIFIRETPLEQLTAGEDGSVITYTSGDQIITHRIIDSTKDGDGKLTYITKGDANNTEDAYTVTTDSILGTYIFRIPKLGTIASTMQQPVGILLFIVLPLGIYLISMLIQKNRQLKRDAEKLKKLQLSGNCPNENH